MYNRYEYIKLSDKLKFQNELFILRRDNYTFRNDSFDIKYIVDI